MPKERYRLYHVEKAKGGIALTMTAGSAVVSRDSPPAFGNLLAYKDEIVPWLRELADECHEHGAAVMIQITHLGRRTGWNKADWLPVLAPSPVREPAHRAFPKAIEDWDIDAHRRRLRRRRRSAMEAAGLDGLRDRGVRPSARPVLVAGDQPARRRIRRQPRQPHALLAAGAAGDPRGASVRDFLVGVRMVADEDWDIGLSRAEGIEIARRLKAAGRRSISSTSSAATSTPTTALAEVIPLHRHALRAASGFRRRGARRRSAFPVFHAARIQDVATARHAIAAGKLDMVGMTRAQIADPHIARKIAEGREDGASAPASAPPIASTASTKAMRRCASTTPPPGARRRCRTSSRAADGPRRKVVVVGAGPAGLEAARVAAASAAMRWRCSRRRRQPGGQILLARRAAAPARPDRHRRLARSQH